MAPSSSTRWLRLLLAGYYPMLALLLALLGWLIYVLVRVTATVPFAWWFTFPVLAWVGITTLQLVQFMPLWFAAPPHDSAGEMRLPPAFLEPIVRLTAGIVRDHNLRMPHDIRLSPDAVAHVYEDGAGERVLVLGGLLVSALSQEALAGVIAHELGHFAAGDTGISRRAAQRWQTMAWLEAHFHRRASMFFNPVIWLIRLYHLAFQLVFFAHSRERELAADGHVVKQAGKDEAAATLILLETLDCLPSLRLANIAKDAAARQEPLDDIFGEQQRRALALEPMDWDDACQKALRRKTTRWSTHPALRDRLKAIGVSPKQATALLRQRRAGRRACELFPAWSELERIMSEQWVCAMRIEQQLKLEAAQVFLGRQL